MARKPFVVDSANVRASSLRQYEPLQDNHLVMFFSSPSVRRILKQSGIVNENGEMLHKGRPHLPKVILPPLAPAPPPVHSLKPSATSTTRLGNAKDDPKSLSVRKPTEMRASEGSWKSQSSRSHFGVKTLKPLSHEEYVNLLQKYMGEAPKSPLSAIPEQPKAVESVQPLPTTAAPKGEEADLVETDKSLPPNSGAN